MLWKRPQESARASLNDSSSEIDERSYSIASDSPFMVDRPDDSAPTGAKSGASPTGKPKRSPRTSSVGLKPK
jgi:hypothetical protein